MVSFHLTQNKAAHVHAELTPSFNPVWCWGWDGAGDIEGPDVEPVWEALKNSTGDPRLIRHNRGFDL